MRSFAPKTSNPGTRNPGTRNPGTRKRRCCAGSDPRSRAPNTCVSGFGYEVFCTENVKSGYPKSGYPKSGYPKSGYLEKTMLCGFGSTPTSTEYLRFGFRVLQSTYPNTGYRNTYVPSTHTPSAGPQFPPARKYA
ncbi:hypothetical protein T484DRAFT_1643888 [Baffinella frigidus]|nr:hypothetical protein T484DRAFT_1643888 [Cryptophyta sp. CCMP2293]